MKALKFLVAVVACSLVAVVGYWLLPAHLFRQAGTLDLGVLIDWSTSNKDNLPQAVESTAKLLQDVLPGDRLAVFAVGPEVITLASGPVSSSSALAILRRQVATLKPAARGGTALAPALARVRSAFDDYLRRYGGKHRRVLVLFSDCVDESAGASGFARLELTGQTTVLVVGFRGVDRDSITKALLGIDGSNDVHLVPPSDTEQAIAGLRENIRSECHPLRLPIVGFGLLLSALVGALTSYVLFRLLARSSATITVRLLHNNDSETSQEFPIHEGGSISVGGGDQIHDYPVPVEASCTITRADRGLTLAPGRGTLVLQRPDSPVVVSEPCPVFPGETFILEGAQITLQQA